MKYNFYGFLLILATIFLVSFTFAENQSNCELLGNSYYSCNEFYNLSSKIGKIYDNSSVKNINYLDYLDCVKSEKEKNQFDYTQIKNYCYSFLANKKSNLKLKCISDKKDNFLDLKCKVITALKDYNIVISQELKNDVLLINPKLVLDSDYQLENTKFDFFTTTLDLKDYNLNDNVNLIINNPVIEIKDNLDSIFINNTQIKYTDMDLIYKSYYDCLTISVLLSQDKDGNYIVKKSGYNFEYTPENLNETCISNISYSLGLDFKQYILKKSNFYDYLDLQIENYLNDSDYDLDNLTTYLDSIYSNYTKYMQIENQIKDKSSSFKLSLDPDFFLNTLKITTKYLSKEEIKNIYDSASKTIAKNKEDSIKIGRKDSIVDIMNSFNKDIDNLKDETLKTIYFDIEKTILNNFIKESNYIDLTDINSTISKEGFKINNFSFDYNTNLIIFGDYNYTIFKDKELLTISYNDYNISTLLTLELIDNAFYLTNEKLQFIEFNNKKEISKINLIVDDIPLFVVTKTSHKSLLGIINVEENIIEKYYATNGILASIDKPWWDFLLFK